MSMINEAMGSPCRFITGSSFLNSWGRVTMEGSRMKYRIAFAISLFALSAGSYANTLCQQKEQDIQREISYAEKHNNQNRINGLKKRSAKSGPTVLTASCVPIIRKKLLSRKKRSPNVSATSPKRSKKAMRTKLPNASVNWLKRERN